MSRIGKVIVLTLCCTLIVYLTTRSVFSAIVVFSVVLIILLINEILNEQKLSILDKKLLLEEEINVESNKKIKNLERSLNYRNELDVGFIHLNSFGRVKYCNEYFIDNIYSKKFEHYSQIENLDVYKVIYDVYKGKKNINNITVNGKHYAIKFKINYSKNRIRSVIIQFYDVTKTQKLDKLHQNFLVDASHELNNPLASIIMASEIIDRENKSEISEILLKESHRMKDVINSIIEHSKLQTTDFIMSDVNFSNLCKNYISIYTNNNVEFIVEVQDDIVVYGNYELLDRMLKNIIDNAFNYTEKGHIKLTLEKVDDEIICKISDTGIGIKKENLENVFERFYRADFSRNRATGGSGIGLAIVKEIAVVHDIVIKVDSEYGEGTTFTLKF